MPILICFLAGVAASAAETKTFSAADVAKHASSKDCWVEIEGKVYDLTAYLPKHPAEESVLAGYCGKNGDQGWKTKDKGRAHSRAAAKLLSRYEAGTLKK